MIKRVGLEAESEFDILIASLWREKLNMQHTHGRLRGNEQVHSSGTSNDRSI